MFSRIEITEPVDSQFGLTQSTRPTEADITVYPGSSCQTFFVTSRTRIVAPSKSLCIAQPKARIDAILSSLAAVSSA